MPPCSVVGITDSTVNQFQFSTDIKVYIKVIITDFTTTERLDYSTL